MIGVLRFTLGHRWPGSRRWLLLVASLSFYGYWDWRILGLLLVTVALNYFAALRIDRLRNGGSMTAPDAGGGPSPARAWLPGPDRLYLYAGVAWNLLCLGFFKYYLFVQGLWARMLEAALESGSGPGLPVLEILLPVGISFYTFQITSYLVDVSRGELRAERSFADLVLFTTYFPQLVAGPIERAGRLLPLLKASPDPDFAQFRTGMILACWGIFKKVFIADNLSRFVDIVLIAEVDPPPGAYFLAACVFAVQIYADFSGYTDVARGVSRMFGIELVLNFNLPFFATNPAEFWRRWHITLGAWLRDYVYIPLGGNRAGPVAQARNVLIVWTLGGLWHGASLGFLVWGFYCGVLVVSYALLAPAIGRLAEWGGRGMSCALRWGGRLFTFLSFGYGLLLFRVDSPEHLWRVVEQAFWFIGDGALAPGGAGAGSENAAGVVADGVGALAGAGEAAVSSIFTGGHWLAMVAFYVWPLVVMQIAQYRTGRLELIGDLPAWLRGIVYAVGVMLFCLFGDFGGDAFFYFQF